MVAFLTAPPLFRSTAPLLAFVGGNQLYGGYNHWNWTFDFGAAAAGLHAIIVTNYSSSYYNHYCKVGTVEATKLVAQNAGNYMRQDMWIAAIPAGGALACDLWTTNLVNCFSADAYRVTGLQSTSPVDTAAVAALGTQNYTNTDIVAPAGSIVIASRCVYGGVTYAWTGLNEDNELHMGHGSWMRSVASKAFPSSQNPLSIGVNMNAATSEGSFIAVCLK